MDQFANRPGFKLWLAPLFACALLFSQIAADQHLHPAGEAAESCVVCVHSDAPCATEAATQCNASPTYTSPVNPVEPDRATTSSTILPPSRAPPQA